MHKVILTISLTLFSSVVFGQATPAEQVAQKIAQKMKDSLFLSPALMARIYEVNMQLHEQKTKARQAYPASPLLGGEIQKVENSRDSLYRAVLTEEQYQRYKQKKRNLVNNN